MPENPEAGENGNKKKIAISENYVIENHCQIRSSEK